MNKKKWILLPVALILVLVIFYCYEAIHFQNRFLPKTAIGGVDVGQLTEAQAEEKLIAKLDQEHFEIVNNGTTWKDIPKKQLGITYDMDNIASDVLKKQNSWLWFVSYMSGVNNTPVKSNSYDDKVLNDTLASLEKELKTVNKDRTQTKNASIEQVDGKFAITPEEKGDSFNTKAVLKAVQKGIKDGISSIELTDYIEQPTLTKDDPTLKDELASINKIAEINASYSINGQNVVIPKDKIASWVTFSNGKVDLKQEAVKAYITELGNTYNTSTNASKFKSTKRGEVSVPAGSYSWTIATDSEALELTDLILKGEDFSDRVPDFQGSASPASPLIGNTYIEVDLSAQHMWYYKDGKSVLDTPVITGKPSTPTPPGVFYVWNKKQNEILRGEDYASPVDFWMPVDWTGVGIHDSPWQNANAYGGNSFQTVGSHGCINTPPSVCAELFNMIDVGVPVIMF